MKIVLLGASGQIGGALQRSLTPLGQVVALGRAEADFTAPEQTVAAVARQQPDVIVNAAAYTAVDRAESEPALARCINATTPGLLARWAAQHGVLFVHYSSDYVFDGSGQRPWREDDAPAPLSVYGRSKHEGEALIAQAGGPHLVLRTSWVYAAQGRNFVQTILRLAQERPHLTVVDDQWGAPTSADWLAEVTAHAVAHLLRRPQDGGLYHCAAAGATTWFAYAALVLARARQSALAANIKTTEILPVPGSAYSTAARRPHNSRLDCGRLQAVFGLAPPPWQQGVARMLAHIL
ncbi:dTDP-4-dehydrorhamnose reductase [uncultured Comamonas sp.]|nr:dTDP-4-dehydrorhamnose reductase [uncultured Comamonas sp.]